MILLITWGNYFLIQTTKKNRLNKISNYINDNFKTVITFVILSIIYYVFFPYDFLYDYNSNLFPEGRKIITESYYPKKVFNSISFVFIMFIPYFIIQILYSLFLRFKNQTGFKLIKLNVILLVIPIILYSISFYGTLIMKEEFIKSTTEFRIRTKESLNKMDPFNFINTQKIFKDSIVPPINSK